MKYLLLLLLSPLSLLAHSLETTISADEVNYFGESIELKNNVVIENNIGRMKARFALLSKVKASGEKKVEFDHFEMKENVHLLLKQGGELCCEKVEGSLKEGLICFGGDQGIVYTDAMVKILAESGSLYFDRKSQQFIPSKVILKGFIRLSKKESQYALSDTLEYFPSSQQLRLLGEKSPVLFMDEEKGVTLSAKEIVAKRGEEEEVHGVGEVRFTLSEEEINKIKERCPWRKKNS